MTATSKYISIGANRSSSCAAITSGGLLAFGAGRLVALWDTEDPDGGGVYATLHGHKAAVTTVKLWRDEPGRAVFVSGDAAGEVRVWEEGEGRQFRCTAVLAAHTSSTSALALCPLSGPLASCILTAGSDGLVKVWRVKDGKGELLQEFRALGKLALDMEVAHLPESEAPLLVIGATDRRIQLWTWRDGNFSHTFSLEGHEDWVRCLAFTPDPSSSRLMAEGADLLLASGSQDGYVRLWRVAAKRDRGGVVNGHRAGDVSLRGVRAGEADGDEDDRPPPLSHEEGDGGAGLDMLDEFERKLGEAGGSVQISTKAHVLVVEEGGTTLRYDVTLEALLIGHEAGLTNLHWSPLLARPPVEASDQHDGPSSSTSTSPARSQPRLQLLSSAADNSLILWTPSSTSSSTSTDGIWVPSQRFGAVGGRGLAFFGALWGKDGRSVLGGGWNGGWERWERGKPAGRKWSVTGQEEDVNDGAAETWQPRAAPTGHFEEVKSVEWEPRGEYLLSVGSDQTSRIHAATNSGSPAAGSPSSVGPSSSSIASSSSSSSTPSLVWAEIARPQIHGYDMTSAAWLGSLRFASGADEKVTRVFDAPAGFVGSLGGLGVGEGIMREADLENRPKGATVPPLGLSNRALGKAAETTDLPAAHVPNYEHDSVSRALTSLPTEEELATSTLWPEVEKVYGHGYEIVSVAASHDGSLLATACRATTAEHAVVRLNSTTTWDAVSEPLAGHTLTVTRIAFSPDDERILTCSRDRGWRMYGRDGIAYTLLASCEKAHARMVLDCCWAPDGRLFATASRDKAVRIWAASPNEPFQWAAATTIKLSEVATAVDMTRHGEEALLAIGTESGSIAIYGVSAQGSIATELLRLDSKHCHSGAVNRVAWRRGKGPLLLASCGDDRSVRVFQIDPE